MPISEAVVLDNLGKIIVFLMLLFVVFLVTVKRSKKLPNYLFAAFLLVTAYDLSGLFLGETFVQHPHLHNLKIASAFLQMPLFYLYVLAVCYADFRLHWKQLAHTIPFWVFLIILSGNFSAGYVYDLYQIVGELQYFAYIAAIFLTLKKHKTVYLENFSNPDYTAYRWLFQATALFCLAHVLVLVRLFSEYLGVSNQWASLLNIVITLSALLVTCWLVMKSMYHPQIFLGVNTHLQPVKSTPSTPPSPEVDKQLKKLKAYMAKEKPYLDYELSLEKLASQMDMADKELSVLINQHLGKHFFDFINEYRIASAKAILSDPTMAKTTVLEILYQVGFNSKSSFYTAFKKETGLTPSKYRKSAL